MRHPCFLPLEEGKDYRVASSLAVTDQILEHSFWVGVYPGMDEKMLTEMAAQIHRAVGR